MVGKAIFPSTFSKALKKQCKPGNYTSSGRRGKTRKRKTEGVSLANGQAGPMFLLRYLVLGPDYHSLSGREPRHGTLEGFNCSAQTQGEDTVGQADLGLGDVPSH